MRGIEARVNAILSDLLYGSDTCPGTAHLPWRAVPGRIPDNFSHRLNYRETLQYVQGDMT
jgi:hypothetical protein